MNFIGKIFVLLIFCMTFVFCAGTVMVYVTHVNWKKVALARAADVDANKITIANLMREKEDLANLLAKERSHRRFQLADQATKLALEQTDKNKLAGDNLSLSSQLTETQTQQQLINEANNYVTAENTSLLTAKTLAEEAHDRRLAEVVARNDELAAESAKSTLLQGEKTELVDIVIARKMVMDQRGLTVHSLTDEPPDLDGTISAVSATNPLVQITLGSDDGLKSGHRLEVFSGNSYLGRIVIRDLEPNRSVGVIVKELQKDNFQRGDRVATKL
jgi:hypothetical protein